ncbi:MAG: nucleotidyl transferase AbiEii/AbiGii toxin family protein [Betaproteobacteria bacterium]|nr:nucleotidyl transferase AbiEii/AbiGii toxin family protein [Betaproteobacteria bacterium]
MPDFFDLTIKDRREALAVAADASGRPMHLLEKDIWVVWSLRQLFASVHGEHLVFKGGTSLSKGYDVIRRFSEDVDLTYDIRAIAGDLIGKSSSALPSSKSQAKRWTDEIRGRLAALASGQIAPQIAESLRSHGLPAKVSVNGDKILLAYAALATGSGYVKPTVILEFGARATGEPSEPRDIVCDAAAHLPAVTFPAARPRVMRPERTFWEKATAIHVFCCRGQFRGGERFARHWHDLTRLDAAGYATSAIADKKLAKAVADHKAAFFAEKDKAGAAIDYQRAVTGTLCLIPRDGDRPILSEDYRGMVEDGLLLDQAESFEKLMQHCQAIQDHANAG